MRAFLFAFISNFFPILKNNLIVSDNNFKVPATN